jgi:hypothetical protein
MVQCILSLAEYDSTGYEIPFLKPRSSSPCWQNPNTVPSTELVQSSSHLRIIIIIILEALYVTIMSHIRLRFRLPLLQDKYAYVS